MDSGGAAGSSFFTPRVGAYNEGLRLSGFGAFSSANHSPYRTLLCATRLLHIVAGYRADTLVVEPKLFQHLRGHPSTFLKKMIAVGGFQRFSAVQALTPRVDRVVGALEKFMAIKRYVVGLAAVNTGSCLNHVWMFLPHEDCSGYTILSTEH